tara:strand:- start:2967 stop:3431 length:465 start_codon:yes stop_codon:yes gene_type:complete
MTEYKIHIVFGTVHGNAERSAYAVEEELTEQGYEVEVYEDALDLPLGELSKNDALLVVISTTGEGELPDTIVPLYTKLNETMPSLEDLSYGIIALGDSSYPHFCRAGVLFDDLMQQLQAQVVLPMHKIDAAEHFDAEPEACSWSKLWVEQLVSL